MRRICAIVLVLLASSGILSGTARAAEASIVFGEIGAEASFPEKVSFRVTATSDSPIVKAELLYSQANLETLNLHDAPVETDESIDITLDVDFQSAFVPAGIDIGYRWRLTDSNGAVSESPVQTITWLDSRFEWETVSTDQVSVNFYSGNTDYANAILESAQSTIDKLQTDFDVARSLPIRIWVYDSKSDFQGSQAPNSQEWIAGTAYPDLQVILAVLPNGDLREMGRIIPHEISHQILGQATANPFNSPPTWFDEGLAVHNQANGNEGMQALVRGAAEDGRLFSIRALTSEFPYDPADASLAYAESYSVVTFMLDTWGNEGMAAIIAAYREGLSHDDVLMQAIGVDMDELDRLWKESLDYQGDTGVAGGTDGGGSGWEALLIDASSVLLGLVVLVSLVAMVRRWRSGQHYPDDPEPLTIRASTPA